MENNTKDSICFDHIERLMQKLDDTNTELNSSSPPPRDLPHRPIILQSEIKVEPKDKNTDNSYLEKGVAANQDNVSENNVDSNVPAQISNNGAKCLTMTPGQHTQNEVQIKIERVEDNVEMSVGTPSKDTDSNESAIQNTHPTAMDSTVVFKSEPVDTASVETDVVSQQNAPTTVTNPENSANKNSTDVPNETNMDSTAPNSPNGMSETEDALPENFFDDLIKDADNITAAALKSTTSNEKAHTPLIQNVKSEPADTAIVSEATTTAPLESTALNNATLEKEPAQVLLNVKTEPVDITTIPETTTSAPIPENFFDDLLVDHVAERIDEVVNQDLEIKYSERLKELEKLEAREQGTHKAHKKHKKKKKKSHKRTHSDDEVSIVNNHKRSKRASRSNSKSPESIMDLDTQCVRSNNKSSARVRVKSEFTGSADSPMEIVNLYSEKPETSASAASRMLRVKSEFSKYQSAEDSSDICLPVREQELFQRRTNINRNGLIVDMTAPLGFKRIKMEDDEEIKAAEYMSPKDKKENAKQRAIAAIEALNKASKKQKDTSFLFTNTVRKLPNSSSYIKQHIYDNRSPLHKVNNVLYKFNSHANQFNLHEWGIEEMPRKAAEVAKILGFDVHALDKKMATIKLPPKIQKIKQEHMQQTEKNLTHTQTSFLVTVSTQTDEVTVLDATAKQRNNIGTQTTAVACNTASNNYEDLPLMRQISAFNENQLMALSDFADLVSEPTLGADAKAMDLYRLRQRMMDIYKCSQLPSELGKNTRQPNKQSMRDPRQEIWNSQQESPTPPPPTLLPQFAQQPMPPIMNQNTRVRDPRQERILAMQESLQPTWPTAHAVVRPPYHQPHAPLQQQPTLPIHPRLESPAALAQQFPAHLPMEPRQAPTPKYYGRGGMRR